jgi:hypothetical protein
MNSVQHTVNSVLQQADPKLTSQDANDPRLGTAAVEDTLEDGGKEELT